MTPLLEKMLISSRATARLTRALKLARRKKWDAAWTAFEAAIEADPSDGRAHAQYGLALSRAGEFDRATERLEAAIEADSKNPAHRFSLAIVLSRVGRWDDADQAAMGGLELNRKNPLGHSLRALVRMGHGDVANACRTLLETEMTDNALVQAMILARIEAHLMQNDPAKTSFIFAPPVEDEPPDAPDDDWPAAKLIASGEDLMEDGRYASAAAFFEKARAKDDRATEAAVALAATMIPWGKPAEAAEILRTVGKDDPFAGFAQLYLGTALLYNGELDEADAVFAETAANKAFKDMLPLIEYLRGLVAIARGDERRAAELFLKQLDYDGSMLSTRMKKVIETDNTRMTTEGWNS